MSTSKPIQLNDRMKAAAEYLDHRWSCVWVKDEKEPSKPDELFYNGACAILVQMGFYWQRKNEKHYVGKEF